MSLAMDMLQCEDQRRSVAGEVSIELRAQCDTLFSSRICYQLGEEIGFSSRDLWEISIAVSELVVNVLKFAGKGILRVRLLPQPRPGIEIEVVDQGPGITDVEAVLVDGYSEGRLLNADNISSLGRRGLGGGLGAVKRFTDELTINSSPGKGTRVLACKWLPAEISAAPC